MENKYQNKYRIPSARLQTWDYSANGAYFITICTKNRAHYFGEIENDKMELNAIGELANNYWEEIPNHFPFIELGSFIVMPNHVHGILIIDKTNHPGINHPVETRHCLVSTTVDGNESVDENTTPGQRRFQNQGKNTISSIVGSYKSVVTKNARKIRPEFCWQTRFHDHIIRNAESFKKIQYYIQNNPGNWNNDKFNN